MSFQHGHCFCVGLLTVWVRPSHSGGLVSTTAYPWKPATDQTPMTLHQYSQKMKIQSFHENTGTSPWIVLVFLNSKQRHRLCIFGPKTRLALPLVLVGILGLDDTWALSYLQRMNCLAFQDIVNLRKMWLRSDESQTLCQSGLRDGAWREVRSGLRTCRVGRPQFTAYLMQNLGHFLNLTRAIHF